MELTFAEVKKALKIIQDWGNCAGERAVEEIDRISKWQNLNIKDIHGIQKALKDGVDDSAKSILQHELKLHKLVYRHDLKRNMKRRWLMRVVKDLNSWIHSTRRLLDGVGCFYKNGQWKSRFHVERGPQFNYICDLQDATGELDPYFILRTPFKLHGNPIELIVKHRMEWICDALRKDTGEDTGFEIYQAILVNDVEAEFNAFFGKLDG